MTARAITHRYDDPLTVIWTRCAAACGLAIVRDDAAFASFDGAATLIVATAAALDPDDNLGQIVLHELCHALVSGTRRRADWGLDNTGDGLRDLISEQATQRLQAALAEAHGLRGFMAVTTQWRPYYDALPPDPLSTPAGDDDPAVDLALAGLGRLSLWGWSEAITAALTATANLGDVVRSQVTEASLWARTRPRHPLGGPERDDEEATCGACAWRIDGPSPRCRHRPEAPPIHDDWRACARWEPALSEADCGSCGACCREGFHRVPLDGEGALARRFAEVLVRDAHGVYLPRPDGRCVALATEQPPWRCGHYAARPAHCRDFPVGGDACLIARRRVGLSRTAPRMTATARSTGPGDAA